MIVSVSQCEKLVRELKDKLKRSQNHTHSEVEHVKYRLIMERHEREKEQADNSAMIKYALDKIVYCCNSNFKPCR